jgi:hypothetical protein
MLITEFNLASTNIIILKIDNKQLIYSKKGKFILYENNKKIKESVNKKSISQKLFYSKISHNKFHFLS